MKVMKRGFLTILCVVAFSPSLYWVVGQTPDNLAVKVPNGVDRANTRERLEERIKLLTGSQTTKDYQQLFALLDRLNDDTEDSFVKNQIRLDKAGRLELTEFRADNYFFNDPDNSWALVVGCGTYAIRGKIKYFDSQVEATFKHGDWYFSSPIVVNLSDRSNPKKCRR